MNNENDHDILIRVETTVNTLCTKIDVLNKKFDKREASCKVCEGSIYAKIDDVREKSVTLGIFKWISGGMTLGIIIIIGYLVIAGTQINTNKTDIKHILNGTAAVEAPKD